MAKGKIKKVSGVDLAILSSRLESIARKMQNTLFRTARSGVLNTAHDFSCVILTADCKLLASAESLPIHVMIGPDLICETIKKYHPNLKRGDAFLHNSPYEETRMPRIIVWWYPYLMTKNDFGSLFWQKLTKLIAVIQCQLLMLEMQRMFIKKVL